MASEQDSNPDPVRLGFRLRVFFGLLFGLRKPDFRAAGTYTNRRFSGRHFLVKWCGFTVWALRQMYSVIPETMQHLKITKTVSLTPIWLVDDNPLANHPWQTEPNAQLASGADTIVIGAGFTGGALAYHWSKKAPADRSLVVLEMGDPSSGSSGRNEGLVVMGRYFKMVRDSVLKHLPTVRGDLPAEQQDQLARQFAASYCKAAYNNADMIEQTIKAEGFACDYAREGWVQATNADRQAALEASREMAVTSGFTDWTTMTPEQVREKSGMQVTHNAGFSIAAASWHPAKWVWCLLETALKKPNVQLFSQTKVTRVEDQGEHYLVHTERGTIRTRHVVNATESYTPNLHRQFHDVIKPMQEQAASGNEGPKQMKPSVGIGGLWFFCGRYGPRVLFGSGGSRLPDHEAGRNQPSRFLTKFVAGELERYFGPYQLHLTNEWSGTVGYTPDEYPIVGLIDGKRQYIIGGMCGSGSGVSFNGGRCIVNRILGNTDETDDYLPEYFSPTRLLDPKTHNWPQVEASRMDPPDSIPAIRRKTDSGKAS